MKTTRSLRPALVVFCISIAIGAISFLLTAKQENELFQFCTTKAYGWPLPWRIDYCECEGSKTVYPRDHAAVNGGLVVFVGLIVSSCTFAWNRFRS